MAEIYTHTESDAIKAGLAWLILTFAGGIIGLANGNEITELLDTNQTLGSVISTVAGAGAGAGAGYGIICLLSKSFTKKL